MVFIDGVKYACATCIKGHRSTACQHTDRQLFAIKKKGRPITQCSHCRELRKTQKVHVKCNCNEKKKEGSTSSQPVAVLPQGTSAGIQSTDQSLVDDDYQPVTGDKTSVEALLNPCQCMTGAECICCRPIDHDHFIDEEEFAVSDTININNNNDNSAQRPTLPPIFQYDNTIAKNSNSTSFAPSWESYHNNSGGYSSYSNSSVAQRNNSYTSSSFTSSLNLQERSYNPPYDDKDNTDSKYRDQSEVLGEEIFRSTSADLANIIYRPFQGCPSAIANGSCCGGDKSPATSICRCGPSCKCTGCDAHAERINPRNSYDDIPQNQSSSGCCSSSHEIVQTEHTVIMDEDGVLLCGCGCKKLNTDCSDCLGNLCEEYLLKQPPM